MTERQLELIELIKKEVKPALGCTEPIAVALAVAKAIETLEENDFIQNRMGDDFVINIEVSSNILKNAMGVGIPGTGMVGLHIAAALGAVCGKSCYGLEVLRELNDASISRAKEIVKQKTIEVGLAKTEKMLFIKASVSTNTANGERHQATVIIFPSPSNCSLQCIDKQEFTAPTAHGNVGAAISRPPNNLLANYWIFNH